MRVNSAGLSRGGRTAIPAQRPQFHLQAGLTLRARITSVSEHHVCSARHCSSTTSFRASAATQQVREPCNFRGDSGHRPCDVPDRKPPSRPRLAAPGPCHPSWQCAMVHRSVTSRLHAPPHRRPLTRRRRCLPVAFIACRASACPGRLLSCRPSNAPAACSLCPRSARTCSHERSRGAGQHNRPGGGRCGICALPSQLHCSGD